MKATFDSLLRSLGSLGIETRRTDHHLRGASVGLCSAECIEQLLDGRLDNLFSPSIVDSGDGVVARAPELFRWVFFPRALKAITKLILFLLVAPAGATAQWPQQNVKSNRFGLVGAFDPPILV
jgi:hypothetical protein